MKKESDSFFLLWSRAGRWRNFAKRNAKTRRVKRAVVDRIAFSRRDQSRPICNRGHFNPSDNRNSKVTMALLDNTAMMYPASMASPYLIHSSNAAMAQYYMHRPSSVESAHQRSPPTPPDAASASIRLNIQDLGEVDRPRLSPNRPYGQMRYRSGESDKLDSSAFKSYSPASNQENLNEEQIGQQRGGGNEKV